MVASRNRRRLVFLPAVALATVVGAGPGCDGATAGAPAHETLDVFAAASLRDLATELAQAFQRHHGAELVFNFAGSNTLAQQIAAAPRADLFLSANERWVDYLIEKGNVAPDAKAPFLTNRLTVVARKDASWKVRGATDLVRNDYKHLALANPDAVPAGQYAKAWLEQASYEDGNVWQAVTERLVPTLDVRAALALVESSRDIVGIVYKTDAAFSDKVRTLFEVPSEQHPPVRYFAATIASSRKAELARSFLSWLASAEAAELADKHGFGTTRPTVR